MFTKEERSTFPYWFAHWCAFNMTALNCHAWKPKYLLHDIEKPWLKLFWPYKKVQKWHRSHNNHHLEWLENPNHKPDQFDWEGMMIDWECSRFTKTASPRTAAQEIDVQIAKLVDEGKSELALTLTVWGTDALKKLGLFDPSL